jgi:succinyl-diaminopimelate desuccinylase
MTDGLSDVGALCRTLCAIHSPIGHEAAIADAVRALAGARWPCVRLGNNLVFGGPTGPGRSLIALFGHLDTVPGDDTPPRIEGDRLVALGAADMKAGLAIMLALMAEHEPGRGPADLAFVFYDREEGPYRENGLGPVLEVLPWKSEIDLALCLEPSANRLQLGCLGTLHAQVRFSGRRAHSARPWEGANAIHAAAPFLSAVTGQGIREVRFTHRGRALVYREVMSVTMAHGGTARNVVPDHFDLNVNFRFAPDRSAGSACALVQTLAGPSATVTFTDVSPAGPVPADNPWVDRLIVELGLEPEPKQAWTDVARLAEQGIPAVNLGPGEPSQAHQRGEWTSLRNLDEGLTLFRRLLSALPAGWRESTRRAD